jgi:hypothetical protein
VSRTDSLDVHKGHNRWQRADFPARAPGLAWQGWFEAADLAGQASFMAATIEAIEVYGMLEERWVEERITQLAQEELKAIER